MHLSEEERIQHGPVDKKFLASYFTVTQRTVDNWMAWLPYFKIGRLVRFDLDAVKRAVNERCGRNQFRS